MFNTTIPEVRRHKILERLEAVGSVKVTDLASEFKVTTETIRRDLGKLGTQGVLVRTHGGAMLGSNGLDHRADAATTDLSDTPIHYRLLRSRAAKEAIAQEAIRFVENGDVIGLDASTTALALAELLAASTWESLVVVTNSVLAPLRLAKNVHITTVCTGGTVTPSRLSALGPLTVRTYTEYRVRKAFFSCKGFTANHGPTESSEAEAESKRALLASADMRVLLVDSSKLERTSLVPLCSVKSLAHLITDTWIGSSEDLNFIRETGVNVHVLAQPNSPMELKQHAE